MSVIGTVLRFFMERGAKDKSYEDLAQRLERDQQAVQARLQDAADTPKNRRQAAHIIGIERWGQRRLRSLLGEPLVVDEYDGYRPAVDKSISALHDDFAATRADTLGLLRELQQRGIPTTQTVAHNDAGPMSIGAWFVYLAGHATREGRMLKS